MSTAALCKCGCGEAAPIAKETDRRRGAVKGEPVRFVRGHWLKKETREGRGIPKASGARHGRWKGGRSDNKTYPSVLRRGHPRADRGGHVREHVIVAERALGKYLPAGAHVHHVNGNTRDNRPQNLVVCQDSSYHNLLHRRAAALDACGRADWLRCMHCGQYDDPTNMHTFVSQYRGGEWTKAYHRDCSRTAARVRHQTRKAT